MSEGTFDPATGEPSARPLGAPETTPGSTYPTGAYATDPLDTSDRSTTQQAKDEAKATASTVEDEAASTAQDVKAEATSVAADAKESGAKVVETAKAEGQQVAAEAKDQIATLVATVREELGGHASEQTGRAASGLRGFADELTSMAEGNGAPSGIAAEVVSQAQARVAQAAEWMEGREPADLLEDVKNFARRKPGTFIAAAALLGLVGGRITSSIVAEKREESDGVDVARQPVAQPAVTYPETPYATEVRTAPQAYADPYAPAPQPSDPYRPEARPVADPYAQPGQDPFAPPAGGSTDGIGR